MKTIRHTNVSRVEARKVQPGMMIAEGIVVDVEQVDGFVYLSTPGADVAANYDETVQVYARLGKIETDSFLRTLEVGR
jgi:hypothetical protein